MKTFNLTSYASGRTIKTISAKSMGEAKNQLEAKGYDCQDDYFLETVEQATADFLKAARYAEIETLMQQDNGLINYKN